MIFRPFLESTIKLMSSPAPNATLSPEQIERLITLNRALIIQHLLRGLAHDLRNNLQVVALGSSLGEENAGTTIAIRVERALDSMVGTLDLLTRLGKTIGGDPPVADLADALSETRELAGFQRNYPTLKLSIEFPPTPILVEIGRGDLVQVLLNLIANAKQAGAGPAEPVVVSVSTPADGRVAIHVDDRGVGMPDAAGLLLHGERDPLHHGGVGLFVSRMLSERAGGQLNWAPRPDGGTRMTLELKTVAPTDAVA